MDALLLTILEFIALLAIVGALAAAYGEESRQGFAP